MDVFRIVNVAWDGVPRIAFAGLLKVRTTVSSVSFKALSKMATLNDWLVWSGAKVSLPLTAV